MTICVGLPLKPKTSLQIGSLNLIEMRKRIAKTTNFSVNLMMSRTILGNLIK